MNKKLNLGDLLIILLGLPLIAAPSWKELVSTIQDGLSGAGMIPSLLSCSSTAGISNVAKTSKVSFPRDKIKAVFKDSPSMAVEDDIRFSSIHVDSQNIRYFYHFDDIHFAEKIGCIYRDVSPRDLPAGKYTYVITRDGHLIFGRVEDGLELGVKHWALAEGYERPSSKTSGKKQKRKNTNVVVAGEIEIGINGPIRYNLSSGSYTIRLIATDDSSEEVKIDFKKFKSLKSKVETAFLLFETEPLFAAEDLLPKDAPSIEKMKILCKDQNFCEINMELCVQYKQGIHCKRKSSMH